MHRLRARIIGIATLTLVLVACAGNRIESFKDHNPKNGLIVLRVGSEVRTHDFSQTIQGHQSGLHVLWDRYKQASPRSSFWSDVTPDGTFIAYTVPPGSYRIKEAELFLGQVTIGTGPSLRAAGTGFSTLRHTARLRGNGESQIVFDVGPREAVYVGDVIYEIRAQRDMYRITVRDEFAQAKKYFERKFKESGMDLKRRLAHQARFKLR